MSLRYKRTQLDYDNDGVLIYRGRHHKLKPSDAEEDWLLDKYIYDNDGNMTDVMTCEGSWTLRENYFA